MILDYLPSYAFATGPRGDPGPFGVAPFGGLSPWQTLRYLEAWSGYGSGNLSVTGAANWSIFGGAPTYEAVTGSGDLLFAGNPTGSSNTATYLDGRLLRNGAPVIVRAVLTPLHVDAQFGSFAVDVADATGSSMVHFGYYPRFLSQGSATETLECTSNHTGYTPVPQPATPQNPGTAATVQLLLIPGAGAGGGRIHLWWNGAKQSAVGRFTSAAGSWRLKLAMSLNAARTAGGGNALKLGNVRVYGYAP
jgi:hypothetical protein